MINKIDHKNYGELITVQNDTYFCRKIGTGPQIILIQPAWGSPSTEWWGIQDKLSKFATVISYDRLGYGFSSPSKEPRTPVIVSLEMNGILQKLGIQDPVLFIGNSLGCLYIRAFMFKYPNSVKGVVLLDPLSPHDNEFKDKLPSHIYKKGGIDKTQNINTIRILQKFHLQRFSPHFSKLNFAIPLNRIPFLVAFGL
jgi:pimeloyl-ACP methyl ester carboxylesterase